MDKIPAIICDIDGTLALRGDRSPYDHSTCIEDEVNRPVVSVLRSLGGRTYRNGKCEILLVSGREEKFRQMTEWWLATHEIPYDFLFMRATDDTRPDTEVKEELYRQKVERCYEVKFVLDDRNRVVKMWRDLGLTCFQVRDGDF